MPKLPNLTGNELIKILYSLGFELIRAKGSHFRLKNPSGNITTVPVHSNKTIPKGLLRKIIREDLEMELDDFIEIINKV